MVAVGVQHVADGVNFEEKCSVFDANIIVRKPPYRLNFAFFPN
jgi:hypothetical protein